MENILKFICSIQASPEAALEFLFGSFLFMGTDAMGGLGALRAWGGFVLGLLLKIQTHLSKICSVGFFAAIPALGSHSVMSQGRWHFLLELDEGFQQQKGPQ